MSQCRHSSVGEGRFGMRGTFPMPLP
jgi:hypothetical protein